MRPSLKSEVGRPQTIVVPPGMTKPSPSRLRPPSLYGLLDKVIRTVARPSVTFRTVAAKRECRVRSTGVRKWRSLKKTYGHLLPWDENGFTRTSSERRPVVASRSVSETDTPSFHPIAFSTSGSSKSAIISVPGPAILTASAPSANPPPAKTVSSKNDLDGRSNAKAFASCRLVLDVHPPPMPGGQLKRHKYESINGCEDYQRFCEA